MSYPPRVCLCMIVKDEAHVISRCLQSVRPLIGHWVIVDTGSKDGTQGVIRELLADVPGELFERPWVDFSHNRNQAIELARDCGDYLLLIDADETLELPKEFQLPELYNDAYEFSVCFAELRYARVSLIASRLPWRYEGVLHEYLTCDAAQQAVPLPGPVVRVRPDGARSRNPRKFYDDATVLESALRDDPDNARYLFYLGQSYRDAGEPAKALIAYQKRAALPGWAEETWYSLLQIARLMELLGQPDADVAHAYARAYQFRPSRAEPLVELARFHRQREQFALAILYARQAVAIPQPEDRLFVDEGCYRWRALDELAIAAFYSGDLAEGEDACQRLLAESNYPPEEAERIARNSTFYTRRYK